MKTFKHSFSIYNIRAFRVMADRGIDEEERKQIMGLAVELVDWCDDNFPDAFYQVDKFNFYTNDDNAAFNFKLRWS